MTYTYPNAVIYRLKCYTNNTYYIGSTVNLYNRMKRHRNITNYTTSKTIIEGGNYKEPKILLSHPCNDKKELLEMEQGFLDTYREKYGVAVLNDRNAYASKDIKLKQKRISCVKYYKKNRETIKEKHLNYRIKNKEKAKIYSLNHYQKNKEKLCENFDCECGGKYTRKNKPTHIKTKIHQKFIQIQYQNQIQKHLS